MSKQSAKPPVICILALPESSGAVLYGLYEVLSMFGEVWIQISGDENFPVAFDVKIVSPSSAMFTCIGGVPVKPHAGMDEIEQADVVIITDLALDPEIDHSDRWKDIAIWMRNIHARGGLLGSVCSGSVLLAGCGFLDHELATTHWAYVDHFKTYFPDVNLQPNRIFIPEIDNNGIITSGGMASWEDLALYLIARFFGEASAIKAAKLFLLGDRGEGQLLFAAMGKPKRHNDAIIAKSQQWIASHYDKTNPVRNMVQQSGLPERTFKRRFNIATGYTPIDYIQTLRIEEAKQMLETTSDAIDIIARQIGYEDPTSFRRLFKRMAGVTPGRYRQRFQSIQDRNR